MNPANEIIRTLRSLRWRMVIRDFLGCTVRATLFFFGVLLVLTAAAWWLGEFRPNPADIPWVLAWPFVFGTAAGLVLAILRRPALERVARAGDLAGATRDRLLTGLLFSRRPDASELERLTVAEVERYCHGRDFRPLLPLRAPRDIRWLAAPIAMLGLLWWDALQQAATRDQRAAERTAEIAGTAGELDRLARHFDRRADAVEEAALKRIAERLKQSAGQMRAEAARGGDAQKTALRELALLEQLVKELRQPEVATPDELKALADALMKHEQTREAARDMQGGNLADAAKKLQQAAAQQAAPSDEQVQKTIQQALEHLAQRKEQLSKQIEKLREQARAGEGGRQELLQQIADVLNEMQQQGMLAGHKDGKGGQKGAGKPMTDEDLKKLLGALQDLKNQQQGDGPAGGQPQEGEGDGDGKISVLNFGRSKDGDENSGDGLNFPSGKPGSDKDMGTTPQPFGKPGADPTEEGKRDQLAGMLGEGESLSALIPSAAAGNAKAARRYKELYQAAAADAEDAVTQENIPLGARFLIKRYFEAIQPKQ
jgi:hypothetical protein